jgi:manganese/iron transport system permease protein/iron/zinc/copper transport system permease protein
MLNDIINYFTSPFQYGFFTSAFFASILVGLLCGTIGVYIVLRGMSYIGHGLSHAIFGGAAVAFVLFDQRPDSSGGTEDRAWSFYLAAGGWGFVSAILISFIVRRFRISADAAIGIVTTASFAIGVAVLSALKRFTRNLDASLFGNMFGLNSKDLILLVVVTVVVLVVVFFFYRQLLFSTFDEETARVYGVPTQWVETFFSLVLAGMILAAMNLMGVTLIAAAIVVPPVIARLLTHQFHKMLIGSMLIGSFTAAFGVFISMKGDIPPSAGTVLLQTAMFIIVLAYTTLANRRETLLHAHLS